MVHYKCLLGGGVWVVLKGDGGKLKEGFSIHEKNTIPFIFLYLLGSKSRLVQQTEQKTVGKFVLKPNQPSKTVLVSYKKSMSKLSECRLINRMVIDVQKICYNFEFKSNQENYLRSFTL